MNGFVSIWAGRQFRECNGETALCIVLNLPTVDFWTSSRLFLKVCGYIVACRTSQHWPVGYGLVIYHLLQDVKSFWYSNVLLFNFLVLCRTHFSCQLGQCTQPLRYHTRDETTWPRILLLIHSCFRILRRSWCTDGTICLQFSAFKFVSSLWILDMYPVVMWMVACNNFPLLASRAPSNCSCLQSLSQNLHNRSILLKGVHLFSNLKYLVKCQNSLCWSPSDVPYFSVTYLFVSKFLHVGMHCCFFSATNIVVKKWHVGVQLLPP